jgi:predicted  nucleic acid-binding Zn-ribbon protein
MELNKKELDKLQNELLSIQSQIQATENTLKQIDTLMKHTGGSRRNSKGNYTVKKLKEQRSKLYQNLHKIAIKLYRYL